MRVMLGAVLGLLAWGTSAHASTQARHADNVYLSSARTMKLGLPFSDAVRVGNVLYLSGMIGVIPGTTQIVSGGIEAETKQALQNIRAVLERNGSSLDEAVKCTVMMADITEWPKMNAVYATFFRKHFPARSAMGVAGLALGARVEVECLATVGKTS